MSHGASTVTRATTGAAKDGLSQAEVWEKVSAIQKGLPGFRLQFDSLEKALRTHVPSTTWVLLKKNRNQHNIKNRTPALQRRLLPATGSLRS